MNPQEEQHLQATFNQTHAGLYELLQAERHNLDACDSEPTTFGLDRLSTQELKDLYWSISRHPRLEARNLGLPVRQAKLLAAAAINLAVCLDCQQQGQSALADQYRDIYFKCAVRLISGGK